jgi:hypothetical protein
MAQFKFEKGDPFADTWRLIWYYGLRHDSGRNDYRLYTKCFLDETKTKQKYAGELRPRIFENMRKKPTAPDRASKRRNGTLLDITDAKFPGTRARYEHPIREILALPRPTLGRLTVLIEDLALRCGYCRPNIYQSMTMQFRVHGSRNFRTSEAPESKLVLKELSHRGGYDEFGLVSALTAEAWYLASIRPEYWGECRFLIACCETAWKTFGMIPEVVQVGEALWKIYNARIIHNIWTRDLIPDVDTLIGSSNFLSPLLPLDEWGQMYRETFRTDKSIP